MTHLLAVLIPLGASAEDLDSTYRSLSTLTEVYGVVRARHLAPPPNERLLQGAIRGLVKALDPHSEYLNPQEFQAFKEEGRGRYAGVGLELLERAEGLVVGALIGQSPAGAAGAQVGDRLLAVDLRPVSGLPLAQIIPWLRGEPGSVVRLTIARGEATLTLEVTRAVVQLDSVEGICLPEEGAYIRLRAFHQDTAARFDALTAALPCAADGLVLDLRNNPGGFLGQAVEVADRLLSDGDVVTTRGRGGEHLRRYTASGPDPLGEAPVVVLVNAGTASAAEVLAGALQDHRRGVLVGLRTFGKGSVQDLIPLSNGGALKLTIAEYLTPSGRSLQAQGLTPDVILPEADLAPQAMGATRPADDPIAERPRESALYGHLEGRREASPGPRLVPADPAVARAVELLKVASRLRKP